ncbi:MAG: class I SAM-dependent methyltransferase [Myxococcota bacterium]
MTRRRPTDDPHALTRTTILAYEDRSQEYWRGSRDHDVSQNIEALLGAIEGEGPHRVLDLGCGPGRDLAAFRARGHDPVGLDGSEAFVRMARAHAGVPVWHRDFLAMELPDGHFDGVFANASLFHVPRAELPRVLRELYASLRPGGVLFSSNPRGENQAGWNGERYGVYHDLAGWSHFLRDAGFEALGHYYRPPGLPRDRQPWLASLWRRPG